MKYRCIILVLFFLIVFSCPNLNAQEKNINYDETKVPKYKLPNPFIMEDGEYVQTAEEWAGKQRAYILNIFKKEMYGQMPSVDHKKIKFEELTSKADALEGKATRKEIRIYFDYPNKTPKADLLVYIPNNVTGPVPAFLGLNFAGNHAITKETDIIDPGYIEGSRYSKEAVAKARCSKYSRWMPEKIIERGYALATIYYEEIEPDSNKEFIYGVHPLFAKEFPNKTAGDYPSIISAWAWGLSRGLDCLRTLPQINGSKVIVIGHSRLGKTALWAGANDTRFAAVISNDSGCGGAALSRRNYGETIASITKAAPHWFCPNFKKYADDVNSLPIDQHELIGLIALRPVYIASAEKDLWADPKGEFLAAVKADPIYRLMRTGGIGSVRKWPPATNQSVGDIIRYHLRSGEHDVTAFDWQQYLDFADKYVR